MNPEKLRTSLTLLFVTIASITHAAYAQTPIPLPIIEVDGSVQVDPSRYDVRQQVNLKSGESLVVTLNCAADVDCGTLDVLLRSNDGDQQAENVNRGSVQSTFEFYTSQFQGKEGLAAVVLGADDRQIATIRLSATPGEGILDDNNGAVGAETFALDTINNLLAVDCSPEIRAARIQYGETLYAADRARFVVAPNGNVIMRPKPVIDEDDIVEVIVISHLKLSPLLKIRRASAFRTPGALNIVGGDVDIPQIARRKAGRRDDLACGVYTVELGDFQPGRAEVSLSALTDDGYVDTGSFDFGVNTLYSGAFSFGAVRTTLKDPSFGLVHSGGDSLLTETEDGAPRVLYTLTYTPFIWGKRDTEKDYFGLDNVLAIRRFNPMFGIVLNDVGENFIAGISYDFSTAVYLTFGAHFGKVRRLNPEADLAVGEAFDGIAADIPTVREWDSDFFVGLSLDLRAATQFFQKALGTIATP